jgi:hypothetical protein
MTISLSILLAPSPPPPPVPVCDCGAWMYAPDSQAASAYNLCRRRAAAKP